MISVVIAAWQAGLELGPCLDALRSQPGLEVIVVGDDLLSARHPEVKWAPSSVRLFPGEARNRGCALASGEIIALLDADCRVPADWAAGLAQAHAAGERVVANALAPPEGGAVAWAAWFCKCARWAPQTPAGRRPDLPSATMSFPRRIFAECGPFLEGTFSSDTAFCWEARRRGYELWFEPAVAVKHAYTPSLRAFLERQLTRGHQFARVRRRHARRWHLRAVGFLWPLLALVLFARTCARVARYRIHRGRFAQVWPLVLGGLLAWAAGEGRGYRE